MTDKLNIQDWKERIAAFAKERDWEQFHTPKNLAMALSVESSELVEHFQWLTEKQSFLENDLEKKNEVAEELADILTYLIRISDRLDINLCDALEKKIVKNAEKYPADRVKGSAKKYNEY